MTRATRNTPPNDWLRQGSAAICVFGALIGFADYSFALIGQPKSAVIKTEDSTIRNPNQSLAKLREVWPLKNIVVVNNAPDPQCFADPSLNVLDFRFWYGMPQYAGHQSSFVGANTGLAFGNVWGFSKREAGRHTISENISHDSIANVICGRLPVVQNGWLSFKPGGRTILIDGLSDNDRQVGPQLSAGRARLFPTERYESPSDNSENDGSNTRYGASVSFKNLT